MESSQFQVRPAWFRERVGQYRRSASAPLRLVYIPTHRDCAEVLRAVLDEIAAARGRLTDAFQLLVIDDRPMQRAEGNRLLAERTAQDSGQVVNWLGTLEWAGFVDSLAAGAGLSDSEAVVARNALLKPSGSYAGGMNKAALMAAYLGAVTLHRRDSDEFPAHDEASGASTLEVEITALSTALPTGAGGFSAPFVVGSSVEGEPTKDHRDLEDAGAHFGTQLEAISRRRRKPGEETRAPVEGTIPVGPGMRVERDYGRAQVGVSASREVPLWIPEMPAVGVLGTDHFQKGLLYQLDLPVYWHPLHAYHKYESWRAEQADHGQLGWYVVAELRYAILRHYWNTANEAITANASSLFADDGQFRPDLYAAAFADVLIADTAPAEAVAEAFVDVYSRAAEAATGPTADRLWIRVKALREERHRAVPYVREAVSEFAQLARLWPRLVSSARGLHPGSQP